MLTTHTAWESFGSSVTLVRWPDSHTLFAQVDTTGKGKDRNGSSVTLVPCRDGHTFFAQVDTTGLFSATLPGLQTGSYRVMVYHTRSSGAPGASPPETGTGVEALHRRHAA